MNNAKVVSYPPALLPLVVPNYNPSLVAILKESQRVIVTVVAVVAVGKTQRNKTRQIIVVLFC